MQEIDGAIKVGGVVLPGGYVLEVRNGKVGIYYKGTEVLTLDQIGILDPAGALLANITGNITGNLIGAAAAGTLSTALQFSVVTGTFTAVNAQTATGTTQVPAGAYVFGVLTRVVTTFDGDADNFATLGTTADDDAWGATLGLTAADLTTPANWTVLPFAAVNYFAAATDIILDATPEKVLGDASPVGLMNYAIYYATVATPAAS